MALYHLFKSAHRQIGLQKSKVFFHTIIRITDYTKPQRDHLYYLQCSIIFRYKTSSFKNGVTHATAFKAFAHIPRIQRNLTKIGIFSYNTAAIKTFPLLFHTHAHTTSPRILNCWCPHHRQKSYSIYEPRIEQFRIIAADKRGLYNAELA